MVQAQATTASPGSGSVTAALTATSRLVVREAGSEKSAVGGVEAWQAPARQRAPGPQSSGS